MVELVKRTLHSARWQLLVLFVVLIESTRAQTYSNTSTQTLYSIRYKTICTCLMPGLEDSQAITCSTNQPSGSSGSGSGNSNNNLRINIINAYMFDSGKIGRNNCTLKSETFGLIKYITDELQLICLTSSNCSISKSFLINLVSDSAVIECLSTSIFYNCVSLSNTPNYTNPSYTFTYFFYIITLVLSSSCILIGALFILRRFLLIRRRTNYSDPNRPGARRRHNRPAFGRGGRSEMGAPNEAGVWTTTANNIYPPPAYEQINDFQTVHMATPPPYDSAAIVKTKLSAIDDPTSSSSMATQPPVSSHAQPNDPNDLRSVVNTSFNMDELDDLQVTSQQIPRPVNANQPNESSSTKAE